MDVVAFARYRLRDRGRPAACVVNFFDYDILTYLNGFARQWRLLDYLIVFLSDNELLKGGAVVSVFWWFWFGPKERTAKNREIVISALLGSVAAVLLGRLLLVLLPFRARPMFDPGLELRPPFGADPVGWDSWSSFPSDHAVLFFALATGFFFISTELGILGFLYVLIVICFPRVYLGLHYPTDIIAGVALGVLVGLIFNASKDLRSRIARLPLKWHSRHPASFYVCFFLFTYQIAILFASIRKFSGIVKVL